MRQFRNRQFGQRQFRNRQFDRKHKGGDGGKIKHLHPYFDEEELTPEQVRILRQRAEDDEILIILAAVEAYDWN